jgi:hypothetical protein
MVLPRFDGEKFTNAIEIDPSIKISRLVLTDEKPRPVALASLGCHVAGHAHPHPDLSDTRSTIVGALYRFGRKMPPPVDRPKFRKFVKNWIIENLIPLEMDVDYSFETFINNAPYTLARKKELTDKYDRIVGCIYLLDKKSCGVKSFIKDETYVVPKHSRVINSRADEFKCVVGPVFQLISDRLFQLPWFIKKIPIKDRPQYISDMLETIGSWYMTTDYTSYEAHFTKEMMHDCEFLLYKYMVKNLPIANKFMRLLSRVLAATNHITFKNLTMNISAKRMSGEMNTSLGNGFSNLMFMLYLCEQNGNKNIRGVIEGDDGLFVMDGSPPEQSVFSNFGLSIKIINFKDLNYASFCGMVFDVHDRTNVVDPIKELISFGWTTRRYARSKKSVHMHLLRAKALSMAYQYPACPILTKLSNKILYLTRSYDAYSFVKKQGSCLYNQYEMVLIEEAKKYLNKNHLDLEPGVRTRMLVETLYGVSIPDQISIEKYIDSLETIKELDCPIISMYASKESSDYFEKYALKINYKQDLDNFTILFNSEREKSRIKINGELV